MIASIADKEMMGHQGYSNHVNIAQLLWPAVPLETPLLVLPVSLEDPDASTPTQIKTLYIVSRVRRVVWTVSIATRNKGHRYEEQGSY